MSKLVLFLGGARSGKSQMAERLAAEIVCRHADNGRVGYLATAEVTDDEFRDRIEHHRRRRGDRFFTYEEPLTIDATLAAHYAEHCVFVLECMTTWLGNVWHHRPEDAQDYTSEMIRSLLGVCGREMITTRMCGAKEELVAAESGHFISPVEELFVQDESSKVVILVANEVGQGLVPPDPRSRAYRDTHGRMVQRLATAANYVYRCEAGIPQRLR